MGSPLVREGFSRLATGALVERRVLPHRFQLRERPMDERVGVRVQEVFFGVARKTSDNTLLPVHGTPPQACCAREGIREGDVVGETVREALWAAHAA